MDTIIQGTDAWKLLRLGKATASKMADLTATTKSGWGASRANYMAELLAERMTGIPTESYSNAIMTRGSEMEPEARAAYEFRQGVSVVEVAFVDHPIIGMSGCSPDGLVGHDGLVEIKAPQTNTHIETLLGRSIPGKYTKQIQWQLVCTNRQWCDFVSYDPRLPEAMRLFVARMERDDKIIAELENQVRVFLAELDTKVKALTHIYGGVPAIKSAA